MTTAMSTQAQPDSDRGERPVSGTRLPARPAKRVFYLDTSAQRRAGDADWPVERLITDEVVSSTGIELRDARPDAGRLLAAFGPEVSMATVKAVGEVMSGLYEEAYSLGYEDGYDEGWEVGFDEGWKSGSART